MVPSIIFGMVFLGVLAAFLITTKINPDLRRQAMGGAMLIVPFGLLFVNIALPQAYAKLSPRLPPQGVNALVAGIPMIWGLIIFVRRYLSDEPWWQAVLHNRSLMGGLLITSIIFLYNHGVLRDNLFIWACLIGMTAMGLLIIGDMFWRKESSEYLNLYQEIINQPESAQKTAVKYPPAAGGIEVKSLKEILTGHKELLRNINLTTETGEVFEKQYMPAIESYGQLVHLLPASENDHHREVGGLLHHGLEVGYYTMAFGRASMYGKELGIKKREARERWLFACFIAGLCHDLGKVADDMRVATDSGLVWSPDSARLMEWAAKNEVQKYYVDWQDGRHKIHESFTLSMLSKVLTDGDREYISEFDKELSKQVMLALTPSSGVEAPSIRPYNIRDMVQKADQQSVKEDKKKSRTPADLGLERPTPLIRHYHDGIQRLLKTGRWRINEIGAAAWVMGPDRGLYLVWPRCGMELYESLKNEGVEGSPAAPEVIADILAENDLLMPAAPDDYYWRIKPADVEGQALTVLRINPKFAPNFVNPFPSSLGGLVQTYEGESSWTYIEAAGQTDPASASASEKIIPLHPNPGTAMERAELDHVIGDHVADNPGPKSEMAPMELPMSRIVMPAPPVQPTEAPAKFGWGSMLIAFFVGVGGCLIFGSAYLVYLAHEYYPQYPYPLYLKLLIYDMMKENSVLQLGLYAVLFLWGLGVFPLVRWKNKKADKHVEERMQGANRALQEAQETLSGAKQEAIDIVADARREGSEIKKTAKGEAAAIREQVKHEGFREKEAIIKQAEADATEMRESAECDAKGKIDQARDKMKKLWSLVQAKAEKMGVPPEELPELMKAMQTAEKEAAAMIAQAEVQAKEAAGDIIAKAQVQAQAEAAEIIAQAQAQAQKKAQELLQTAREEASDIVDEARAGAAKIKQSQVREGLYPETGIQVDSPEENISSDEYMKDMDLVPDQVAALEGKIWGILSGQQKMTKRDLERKAHKSRYGSFWELAISNLLASGKIFYDANNNTYRCHHELF